MIYELLSWRYGLPLTEQTLPAGLLPVADVGEDQERSWLIDGAGRFLPPWRALLEVSAETVVELRAYPERRRLLDPAVALAQGMIRPGPHDPSWTPARSDRFDLVQGLDDVIWVACGVLDALVLLAVICAATPFVPAEFWQMVLLAGVMVLVQNLRTPRVLLRTAQRR